MFNEDIAKAVAAKEAQAAQSANMATAQGYAGGLLGCDKPYRSTLRDRLKWTIKSANDQNHKARKANELVALLEKNPEVARILELIEELQ